MGMGILDVAIHGLTVAALALPEREARASMRIAIGAVLLGECQRIQPVSQYTKLASSITGMQSMISASTASLLMIMSFCAPSWIAGTGEDATVVEARICRTNVVGIIQPMAVDLAGITPAVLGM